MNVKTTIDKMVVSVCLQKGYRYPQPFGRQSAEREQVSEINWNVFLCFL